jgi:uncharacterized protein DUF6064
MPEWWSYTFSDFLLFSPRTYYQLIEHYNEILWPVQIVTIALGLVMAGLVRRPAPWRGRAISAILAALWTWVPWAFLWQRYAIINWAIAYFAWLFGIEVLLLVWIGVVRGGLGFQWSRNARETVGIALFMFSLTLYPMLAPLLRRGWRQAEVFGVAPDPTVIATLGLLLLVEGPPRWGLLAVPVLWCLVSGATLLAMSSPEGPVLLLAVLLAVVASAWPRRWSQSPST